MALVESNLRSAPELRVVVGKNLTHEKVTLVFYLSAAHVHDPPVMKLNISP